MPFPLFLMLQETETTFQEPSYFFPVVISLLVIGALGWLVATVLGFARARAFGASARWFSFVSLCLLLFHLQFLGLAFGLILKDMKMAFAILTFFNGFVVLGAFCAIMGFVRLTSPR
ncbi:MAG: hypothetical protein QOE77_3239 [Blastocatellia bacterium]|jgi:hypothetical protein|nr:hypothetical protein [Blastocatellia bacterium]